MPAKFRIDNLCESKKILSAFKLEGSNMRSLGSFQQQALSKLVLGECMREIRVGVDVYSLTDEEKKLVQSRRIPPYKSLSFDLRKSSLSFNPSLDKKYFDEISKDGNEVLVYYHFKSDGIENNLFLKLFY